MRMQNVISPKQCVFGAIFCTIGAFFYCYEFVLRIIPGALQGELSEAYGNISAATFGQIAALYYFAYSPMQVPVGMLMDRFGPRRLLTFACVCCTLGSFMFSFSGHLAIAGTGRFLVGFGSSFAFVGVLSLAVHWLPRRYFSLVTGLVTTLSMLGVVYGEVKVTKLASTMGLNYVLSMTIIFGAVLTCLIYIIVRDGPGGVAVKTQALSDFLKEVFRVLVSPQVWFIGVVGACLYTSLSVFGELWGKSYLEHAHHLSKIQAAESISLVFLGWALGAPLSGYWSDKTSRRARPLIWGACLSLLTISIVLYCPNLSLTALNILLFVYGVASGSEIIIFIMAKENTQALVSGTVFAVVNMIVSLGGVVFQPFVGILLDFFGHGTLVNGEHVYAVRDYQIALSVIPISLLFVVISGYFLKDRHEII